MQRAGVIDPNLDRFEETGEGALEEENDEAVEEQGGEAPPQHLDVWLRLARRPNISRGGEHRFPFLSRKVSIGRQPTRRAADRHDATDIAATIAATSSPYSPSISSRTTLAADRGRRTPHAKQARS